MVDKVPQNPVDKLNNWLLNLNNKLSNLQTEIIDKNLDKLELFSKIPSIVNKVNTVLDVNLFGLWTVGWILGVKLFDMNKYKDPNHILNLVFKKYGGIEWLHKVYIQTTLNNFFEDQGEKREVIENIFTLYQENTQNNICSDILQDPDSFNIVCNLWLNSTTPTTITDKIPSVKFSYLSDKIMTWIDNKKHYLDPVVLAELWLSVPQKLWPNWTKIIDETSPDWKPEDIDEAIIQKYLIKRTSEFVSNESYMTNIPSADHFAFALMGWLFVAGNVFPEAVLLWIDTPKNSSISKHDNLPENFSFSWKVEDMKEQDITNELLKFKSPLTAQMVINSAKKYAVPMSYMMAMMKNDSWYGSQWLAVTTHNPGNVGNMDDGSMKDRWTREAGVDAVAENLQWRISEYQKVYGNETFPSLKELSSNVGSDGKWFLSTQGNYLQENTDQRIWAYMTADGWPDAVQNYQSELSNEPETQLA